MKKFAKYHLKRLKMVKIFNKLLYSTTSTNMKKQNYATIKITMFQTQNT